MKLRFLAGWALVYSALILQQPRAHAQDKLPDIPPAPDVVLGEGSFHISCEPNTTHTTLLRVQTLLKDPEFKLAVTGALINGPLKGEVKVAPNWNLEIGDWAPEANGAIIGYLRIRMDKESAAVVPSQLAARDWLKAVRDTLEFDLRRFDAPPASQIQTRDVLRSEVTAVEGRLKQLRNKEFQTKKVLGISQDAAARAQIEMQRASTEAQQASAAFQNGQLLTEGLRARQKALERQIAELGKKLSADAANDPVVVELQKVVKARDKLLATVHAMHRVAAAGGGEDALANAEGGLAEARAELAKYQRVAAQSAGGDRLAELNKRLADTQIELAEAEVRNEILANQREQANVSFEKRSREAQEVKTESAEVSGIGTEIQIEEGQYRKLVERLRDVELELKLRRPPTVTVIPQS